MNASRDEAVNDIEKVDSNVLSRAVEGLPGLFSLMRPDGELEYANRQFLEFFGFSLEQLKNWGSAQYSVYTVHPDDRPKILIARQESIETGRPFDFICRRRRADGAYRWLHSRGFPLKDAEGRIFLWYFLQTDIHDLTEAEARNAAILNAAMDCIVTIDHEGRITEFNPAAERTFGYRRDEVMGKHLGDVIVPASLQERNWSGLVHSLATDQAQVLGKRIEMTAIRSDGSEFPIELAITRVPIAGPPSYTGYLRDITERHQVEAELRRSEAYLAEAQKLSATGSFGWNVSTDKHFWSDETFRIFGYDIATKITLQLILDRVHPQDVALMKQAIALGTQGRNLDYECRLLMPDGSIKQLHIVAHLVGDRTGNLEYVGAVMDITATRRAEDALRQRQAELAHVSRMTTLGELTASIAHEVNQPLGSVINNATACLSLLSPDVPQLIEVREALADIIEGADRASAVISRVRQLSMKVPYERTLVSLSTIVTDVLTLARYEAAKRQVSIRTDLADDLPSVLGDGVQLQQVLLNLVVNGMDAMNAIEESKRVLFICGRGDKRDRKLGAVISVQDVGCGFEPETMNRLFEAFYSTKPEGMGMGLAISRSIVESHGGRLWAEKNPGPGAIFLFSLPAANQVKL